MTDFAALASRAERALDERDLGAFLDLVAADADFVPLVAGVEGGSFRGHAGVRRWLEALWSAWERSETSFEVDEVISDRVALFRYYVRLTGRGSGAEVERSGFQVVEADERGNAARWRFFDDRAPALALAADWAQARS